MRCTDQDFLSALVALDKSCEWNTLAGSS